MLKIATHNSATGEPGKGLLSWLLTPFARCQSKTIREQLEAGVTYFDLRVRYNRNGELYFAHGLWTSKSDPFLTLWRERERTKGCFASVTYEGELDEAGRVKFIGDMDSYAYFFRKSIKFTTVNVKKPTWETLKTYNSIPYEQSYKKLDGSTWHTYLPLPWLWKTLYHNRPQFNEETYTMVDFV